MKALGVKTSKATDGGGVRCQQAVDEDSSRREESRRLQVPRTNSTTEQIQEKKGEKYNETESKSQERETAVYCICAGGGITIVPGVEAANSRTRINR